MKKAEYEPISGDNHVIKNLAQEKENTGGQYYLVNNHRNDQIQNPKHHAQMTPIKIKGFTSWIQL